MPQLTPPRQTSQGSGIRPRVVNQYVYVPSPNENNVMLTFSRTDTMDVLCQTKICFDVLLDDVTVHSVTVEYDNVTRRPVLRMGSYTPRILNEEQARSVLDPRSWSQATVDQYRDKSKCPLLRAMIELIVKCSKDRMPIELVSTNSRKFNHLCVNMRRCAMDYKRRSCIPLPHDRNNTLNYGPIGP